MTYPKRKYWRGCVPGIPGGVHASVDTPKILWANCNIDLNLQLLSNRVCILSHAGYITYLSY